MPKTYVLDTNLLLHNPSALFSFEENHVVIPLVVVEEIDNQKKRQDEIGRNARLVSQELDHLRIKADVLLTFRTQLSGFKTILDMNFLLTKGIRVWYPRLDECGYPQIQFEPARRGGAFH